jgi:hypothetical protein
LIDINLFEFIYLFDSIIMNNQYSKIPLTKEGLEISEQQRQTVWPKIDRSTFFTRKTKRSYAVRKTFSFTMEGDVSGVRISPPVVEFYDTEPNNVHQLNVTVKNISKTSKSIRFYGPKTKVMLNEYYTQLHR